MTLARSWLEKVHGTGTAVSILDHNDIDAPSAVAEPHPRAGARFEGSRRCVLDVNRSSWLSTAEGTNNDPTAWG